MQTRNITIGMPVPEVHKVAYQKALDEANFKPDSSHIDAYAISKGYTGALLSGYILFGYINELLVNFFGEKWYYGGDVSLAFINKGVRQRDQVTIKGTVNNVTREPDGERVVIDFWM